MGCRSQPERPVEYKQSQEKVQGSKIANSQHHPKGMGKWFQIDYLDHWEMGLVCESSTLHGSMHSHV